MSSKFANRSSAEEIMDDLSCNGEVVFQTLRELEIINRVLGGNNVTIDGIEYLLAGKTSANEFTIADLGCGGGDILKRVERWGRMKKISLRLYGIDANPFIVDFARKNSDSSLNINYDTANVLIPEFSGRPFDIILATLFTHHFSDQQLIDLFKSLKTQARIGIVINDIHRHPVSYYAIKLLTSVFSKSSMVKFDAPLSVLRAFKRKEIKSIMSSAGIFDYRLSWKWAFRWQLIIPITR